MFDDICYIYLEYNTCELKSYSCKEMTFDAEKQKYAPVQDCEMSPFDYDFWMELRKEPIF
jgi:hypothetical protein